jgi:hypothetical protein
VIDPLNQKNPLHPDQTSVSVARRCERQRVASPERQFPKIPPRRRDL